MGPAARRVLLTLGVCLTTACATGSATRTPDAPPAKNFVLPVVEIFAFEGALHTVDRQLFDDGTFDVTAASIRRNLRGGWVVDQDAFVVNQFMHPYQGSIYHGIARSSGLNYWQSLGYTFGGSLLWEIAGETTPPSKNDQIASGIAGTFFGEAMFRAANLLADKAGGRPGPAKSLLILLLSPPTGLNRALGDRFKQVMPTNDPLYDTRIQLGVAGPFRGRNGTSSPFSSIRDESMLEWSFEYGLPGKKDYPYSRPFDYFSLQISGSSLSQLENLVSRGMLAGRSYEAGNNGRGIVGLFGSYDYLSPDVFRVSSTALSFGTTTQWWSPGGFGVQLTGLAGAGFAAAETLTGDHQNHYGVTPQGAAVVRLTAGDRLALDFGARGYLVSDIGGYKTPSNDLILRGESSIGLRLFGRQAVTLKYIFSRRDASIVSVLNPAGTVSQRRETVGIFYTLLGPHGFGATRWR